MHTIGATGAFLMLSRHAVLVFIRWTPTMAAGVTKDYLDYRDIVALLDK